MSKIEKSEEYIKGVIKILKGRPDAECIEILREKVEFWYMSACFWKNEFLEVSEEEVGGGKLVNGINVPEGNKYIKETKR